MPAALLVALLASCAADGDAGALDTTHASQPDAAGGSGAQAGASAGAGHGPLAAGEGGASGGVHAGAAGAGHGGAAATTGAGGGSMSAGASGEGTGGPSPLAAGGGSGANGLGGAAGQGGMATAGAGQAGASAGQAGASAGQAGMASGHAGNDGGQGGGAGAQGGASGQGGEPALMLTPAPLRITTSRTRSCAVLETGAVECWGEGDDGWLGYGGKKDIGDDEPASKAGTLPLDAQVVGVAGGLVHACVLLSTGAVRCWGSGGLLGTGNLEAVPRAADAKDVPLGGKAVQITVGDVHTCALLEGGGVRCWGGGQYGQLGYGNEQNIGDDETPADVGDVPLGGKAVQVSAGLEHTCALLETGAVRCWGEAGSGALGYGNHDNIGDDEPPSAAGDVPVGAKAVQVSAGGTSTCAVLEGGALRCWGSGDRGALGYDAPGDGDDIEPTIGYDNPASAGGDVQVGGEVVQVTVGLGSTCALLKGGAVRCWGEDKYGELGYGKDVTLHGCYKEGFLLTSKCTHGPPVKDVPVGGKVVQISMGHAHVCALLDTGALRCWGPNDYGDLGYGNTKDIGDDEPASAAGDVPLVGKVMAP